MDQIVDVPFCGAFSPRNSRDRDNLTETLELIAKAKDPFGRDPLTDHITASAFIYSPDYSQILLAHHRKLDRWLQLGGHCDGIADARFVAQKEAYEESGLARLELAHPHIVDIDIHTIPGGAEPEHRHFDIRYAFTADPFAPLTVSNESKALLWCPLKDLGQWLDPRTHSSATIAPSFLSHH